jgi:hypothetical protein
MVELPFAFYTAGAPPISNQSISSDEKMTPHYLL